ncbi:MAG: glucose-1-phosphate adenylyltransferase [Myxococcales bacterium]|nr:glucose-1-phosphate adenylyltransferase [Myxococcota bacterium]MDW8282830.1 glucose-1-phosphate adenylyltransferase [Myxococcales bacterium]
MRPRPKFSPHRGPFPHVLSIVLAGGEGKRLWPLTADRAKPAVPMGGRYRLIDFVLSNLVNSGLYKIKVLTQYMSDSLNTHLARGWRLSAMLDQYVEAVPAQQRRGRDWFKGSADAIYQSLNIITDENPDFVCVFGGDHVYKMDVRQMLDFHLETESECTVAAIPVPVSEASSFGIIEVDEQGRIVSFHEKPQVPVEIPGRPGWALASMGNYIFTSDVLIDELRRDAEAMAKSQHDFGRNILPDMVAQKRRVFAYDFMRNQIPGAPERERGYWRDVGTIAAYYAANMDLVAVTPIFDLYNPRWPLRTWANSLPPAKFVFHDPSGEGGHPRIGFATDSLISEGCIISGGRVDRSVLGPRVRVNSFAHVEESILNEGVDVGRHCKIRRAIIDKHVRIPPHTEIGLDPEADRRRFHVVDGIVVIPKNHVFE